MGKYKLLILIALGIFIVCCLGCDKGDKKKTEKMGASIVQDAKTNSDTSIKQQQEKLKLSPPKLGGPSDWSVPATASNYLAGAGLPTSGYDYDGLSDKTPYGAISDYQQLGSGFPLANNIAYYVVGTQYEVKELQLVLNVNVLEESVEAHAKLLEYSKILYQKAFGKALPPSIKTSVTKGESGQWQFDQILVKLARDNWATGKGYSLKFTIGNV